MQAVPMLAEKALRGAILARRAEVEKLVHRAAIGVYAEFLSRIFDRGELSSYGKIGKYKSYRLYVSRARFVKKSAFKAHRKQSKTFKTLRGWGGVRAAQGMQTSYVDLLYSGSLRTSILLEPIKKRGYRIVIKNKKEASKAINLERLYKARIFAFGRNEIVSFYSKIKKI